MICDKCIKKPVCKIYDGIETVGCIEFVGVPRSDVLTNGQAEELKRQMELGKWLHLEMIPDDVTGHMHGECSKCHMVRIVDNYCPNCGAKMEVSE